MHISLIKAWFQTTQNAGCSLLNLSLQKLNIQHTGIKLNELVRSVRKKLCHSFLNYWNKKSKEPEGKLDTYFKTKKMFLSGNIFIY